MCSCSGAKNAAAALDLRFSQSLARYYQLEDDLLCWHVFKGFVSSLLRDSVRRVTFSVLSQAH